MIQSPSPTARNQMVVELQGRMRQWERQVKNVATTVMSTGCDALDSLFPCHGIRRGSLVEWVGDGQASGVGTMALLASRRWCTSDRPVVLVDSKHQIYPVALDALGFDLRPLVLIRPSSERETLWACEETLRCGAIEMVWATIEHLPGIAFRRLQLAAEESGTVAFLVRPANALNQPSWADVRLRVTPRLAQGDFLRFHVESAYSHGRSSQSAADIEWDPFHGTLQECFDKNTSNETHRMSGVS